MISDDDFNCACRWALARLTSGRSIYKMMEEDEGLSHDDRVAICEISQLAEANASRSDEEKAMEILRRLGKRS